MGLSNPEVAIECGSGLLAERCRAESSAFSEHDYDFEVEINIGHPNCSQLPQSNSCVEEEADVRLVPTLLEALAGGRREQGSELIVTENGDRWLLEGRRLDRVIWVFAVRVGPAGFEPATNGL
jgi:hypothetical protein